MSLTLSGLRDRVETILADTSNNLWATTDIDEGIRQALEQYSLYLPYATVATLTLSSDGREIDISSLDFRTVERVAWSYDSSDPDYPPNFQAFELYAPGTLMLLSDDEPESGDVIRLWLTTAHTLNGLDSATTSTVWTGHASVLARGAAGYAAMSRGVDVAEQVNIGDNSTSHLLAWGQRTCEDFLHALHFLSTQAGLDAAGIAAMSNLDRWEDRD